MAKPRKKPVPQHHRVRLDKAGRIVIPAGLRRHWHLKTGDTLLLTEEASGATLRTLDNVIKETGAYFKRFIPAGVSLVDELLADRRDEAARE